MESLKEKVKEYQREDFEFVHQDKVKERESEMKKIEKINKQRQKWFNNIIYYL